MEIKDKIILITGSTQGIGRAIAETHLEAGGKVVINSRNEANVWATVKELSKISNSIFGIAADVSQSENVKKMVEKIRERWGGVDILVNNAGVAKFAPILDTSEHDWEEMQNVNLKGVFLTSKAVLPEMIKKKSGHILTITSVAAKKAFPNCSAYSASKAGALAFMEVLRQEVRQFGIRVTSIIAGATATPLWDAIPGDFPTVKMINVKSISLAVLAAIQNPGGMVEEIQIRPPGGDL